MKHPWPSLVALRTFREVCRQRSFKAAAARLHVSPAAVSQQVKALEAHFEVRLLLRGPRGLELTAFAKRMLPDLEAGFERLEHALLQVPEAGLAPLHFAAAPAFVAQCLAPRLEEFVSADPTVELRIHAAYEMVDYATRGIDIGVRYGRGDYPGLVSERLMNDAVVAVCSPALRERGAVDSLSLLCQHPLLHDDSLAFDPTFPTWHSWLSGFGGPAHVAFRGVHFNAASDAIAAALSGGGVLLTRLSLIQAELESGALVRPTPHRRAVPHGFFIVYRSDALEYPRIRRWRDRLHERFARRAA